MSDYLAWYLIELRSRLDGKMPIERVETIVAEVESHLRESVKRNIETPGVGEERAVVAAMHTFGSPEKVALSHLGEDRKRMFGIPRTWVVLGAALTAIGCWNYHWMTLQGLFDSFGETKYGLTGCIGGFALGLFFIACRGGYRSYRLPLVGLTAGTAIGLVFLISFLIVGADDPQRGFSRLNLARDEAIARVSLTKLDQMAEYVRRGIREVSAVDSMEKLPLEYRSAEASTKALGLDSMSIPVYSSVLIQKSNPKAYPELSAYVRAMVDGRIFGIRHTGDAAEARRSWQKAPQVLASIEHEKQSVIGLLESASRAHSGQLFFFIPRAWVDPIGWTIIFLPALLFLDALAYLSARRRRPWPRMGIA